MATAARAALVEALALAGRLDEAAAAEPLLGHGQDQSDTTRSGVRVRLDLAGAAVAATRWSDAARYLDAAVASAGGSAPAGKGEVARIAVLRAEIALAAGDVDGAVDAAGVELAAARSAAAPALVCHALELIGRGHRRQDLGRAAEAFQLAYAQAERADLPAWRLRASHDLGTIDLLDHGGTDRLLAAREIAGRLGMLSTVAVLDLQLAGAYLQRYDIAAASAATDRAVSLSVYPLVVAASDRGDAPAVIAAVQSSGVAVNRVNRGYLAYADAVVARSSADLDCGDSDLALFPVWRHLGMVFVGEGLAALREARRVTGPGGRIGVVAWATLGGARCGTCSPP